MPFGWSYILRSGGHVFLGSRSFSAVGLGALAPKREHGGYKRASHRRFSVKRFSLESETPWRCVFSMSMLNFLEFSTLKLQEEPPSQLVSNTALLSHNNCLYSVLRKGCPPKSEDAPAIDLSPRPFCPLVKMSRSKLLNRSPI